MEPLRVDPHIVVLSSLFPNRLQPMAGLFVRERMFRVAQQLPLSVVAPVPWFPFQSLMRLVRPGFRPPAPGTETQDGTTVFHPLFFSIPGAFKSMDGLFMAIGCLPRFWRLKRLGRLDIIDAHFAYPDGYAATLLGKWLNVPVTITMRGTETRHVKDPVLRPRVCAALSRASRVFSVSDSLRQVALSCGIDPSKLQVIGNGVDIAKFSPQAQSSARDSLGIPRQSKVLVTVGGLVERKGFHRVIAAMPELLKKYPNLTYLIIGGPSPEGDWTQQLKQLVSDHQLDSSVRFLGPIPADKLSQPLSAADVFVLSTRNEGWANVLLEAMACGLPVVATDVGGNREVVSSTALGAIVPFDDDDALVNAITQSLATGWDRAAIRAYAEANTWDSRVVTLVKEFRNLSS
ncbi:MAG TPA: glycosyltransferase [Burkholderiaceae bacterium]|nr:glycosyltransferase [Burkholderiaceae bacterium]